MNKSQKSLITTIVVALATSWVVGAPQASAAHSCFGKRATIEGNNRDPRRPVELTGTSGNDVIVGLKGWDIIRGRGGHDLICAGAGDDDIRAGEGNDKVKGQEDFDNLNGGRGNDQMLGGRGAVDALLGGAGNDRLRGGPGHEDSLIGGAGDDVMDGGRGYDLAEFWDSPGGIHADLRSDTAVGYGDDQIVSVEGLVGSNSDDVLFGDELSNLLVGQEGNDEIHAFGSEADGGTDILRSGGGEDLLDGGDGQDTVSYRHSPLPVDADLTQGQAVTPGFGVDNLVGIEHLIGSRENDTLIGNDADNLIAGHWGNDDLDGRGGRDEIAFFDSLDPVSADLGAGIADAGPRGGLDTFVNFENLSGSAWNDVLVGDDEANLIWGGSRADSIHGLGGDDVLLGAAGTDEARGGDGTDQCEAETEFECEFDPQSASSGTPSDFWLALRWLQSVGSGMDLPTLHVVD